MISLRTITNRFGAWLRYQRAFDELSRFTDRELHDIGLCRDDIPLIAANAAREAAPVYPFLKVAPAAQVAKATSNIVSARGKAWTPRFSNQLP